MKSVRGEQYLGNDSHAVTYMQCAIILNIEEFSYKRLKLNERKPFALKNLLLNDANNFQQLNKKEKKNFLYLHQNPNSAFLWFSSILSNV